MIEEVLPAPVRGVDSFGDRSTEWLYPEEAAVVARAVEGRRREFAAVRHCARTALARIGVQPGPILPGANREPQWPKGVVGSMTHCPGYCAAALARTDEMRGIGIDAEVHEPLPDGTLRLVSLPDERAHLAELGRLNPSIHWDKVLFTMKESVYKVWFPLQRTWLGFDGADVSISPSDGTFRARLLVPGPVIDGERPEYLDGRWKVSQGLAIAAIAVPAPGR